jgi:hypothetical protein
MKIYWSKTGDYFDVSPIDNDLSSWFVDQCKHNDSGFSVNVFETENNQNSVDDLIDKLKNDIVKVNDILSKFKLPLFKEPTDYFNQFQLNELHKDWIRFIQTYPKSDSIFLKFNIHHEFHEINRLIHCIETSFSYVMRCRSFWKEPNPFMDKQFPNGVFNVSIAYANHGKNSWEKFINFDDDPKDYELNQWTHIGSYIKINLVRPYLTEFPKQFLEYCATNSIEPVSNLLPFGNLTGIKDNLAVTRQLMNRNIKLTENFLKFDF